VATWYEHVNEVLAAPPGAAPRLEGEELAPGDAELLLRAATDLLPPAQALALSARIDVARSGAASTGGLEPSLPGSWAELVDAAHHDVGFAVVADQPGPMPADGVGSWEEGVGEAIAADDVGPDALDLDLGFGTGAAPVGGHDDEDGAANGPTPVTAAAVHGAEGAAQGDGPPAAAPGSPLPDWLGDDELGTEHLVGHGPDAGTDLRDAVAEDDPDDGSWDEDHQSGDEHHDGWG
jgi:hypothetical protein